MGHAAARACVLLMDLDTCSLTSAMPGGWPPRTGQCSRGVWLCWSLWPWHPWGMRSVYEAAGGSEGLLRLAEAWHSRVMADEIVSHAFSHGFHPQHSQRLAAY
jgi:hypothetical protein